MATMDDIAKRLGVAKSTVSKAFSGAPDVSDSTRKLILQTAIQMGYSKTLRSREEKAFCVFVENMRYKSPEDFGWEVIAGFRQMAELVDYRVEVMELTHQMQTENRYDTYMLTHGYLGASSSV